MSHVNVPLTSSGIGGPVGHWPQVGVQRVCALVLFQMCLYQTSAGGAGVICKQWGSPDPLPVTGGRILVQPWPWGFTEGPPPVGALSSPFSCFVSLRLVVGTPFFKPGKPAWWLEVTWLKYHTSSRACSVCDRPFTPTFFPPPRSVVSLELPRNLDQGFSASALLTLGAEWFFVGNACPVHYRMFNIIPVLYPTPVVKIKNVSKCCQMRGKNGPGWEPPS